MPIQAAKSTPKARSAQKAPAAPADAAREWGRIREALATGVPESTFRMWIAPLKPVALRGETLHLDGPDPTCTWVERRYMGLIDHAISRSGSPVRTVTFEPAGAVTAQATATTPVPGPNPTHTFDRFVIGPGNHLAHAAALAVAEAPSEAYNPLFLHGDPGLGKTHLLGAIANYLEQNVPELNVLFTNAEAFTAEFVAALRENGTEEFKRRYRDLDVLLIDDIQFIAGKARTEEEFFHTFNALHEAGAQIVLSADRMPSDISTLADRLSDRFEWGLTVELDSPNLATRLTVLRHLVTEAGLEIADQEALTLLARRVESNLRQLRGALTRTIAEASLHAVPVTAEMIASVFPGSSDPAPERVSPEWIRETAAAYFDLDVETITGRRRDNTTRTARNIAIYLTREMTELSLPQIGLLYGGRDPSTILNSVNRVEEQLNSDPQVTAAVETLRARIHSPAPQA